MFLFHVLLCIALCPFYFCNKLDGEEKAGCFTLFVFLVIVIVLWLFLTVSWLVCSL